MDAYKIVMHRVDRDRVRVIFRLFEKPFVRRVRRRIPICIVRLARSA